MDKLDQYRIFVQVAEMGSFIKAAHALDVPRASVSAAVQQLESAMGTRLLHRMTRQVRPTADGVQLLERVPCSSATPKTSSSCFMPANAGSPDSSTWTCPAASRAG
ncbi:LysR family transcriptional regulator [Stenotrophomonas rhizophila]|uniref:LysR family transcriptional regulator n=1 Tax=Stenotrophomonas rhizophila TaxID=216778 RepID=UPI0028AB624E|nr:LysR family transcriptional regulator [Stenotrophomonas rhizophila]